MSATTMRVAELPGHGQPLRSATRPVPEPGEGEVRVRVQACGVCGSDVFLQDGGFGPHTPLPVVPGHEAAGVVEALGPGVDPALAGAQVALYYISTPPGDAWAAAGYPNRSPQVKRMGVDLDGAFAEYVLRPVSSLVLPPRAVPPAVLAVLTDAVGTPLHALRRVGDVRAGETVAIVGIGGLGSSAIQLARAMGAHVIAVSRSAGKLDLARRLGAEQVVVADGFEADAVRKLTGGHGPELVLQCAEGPGPCEQALQMVAPGGRVVLVGSSSEPFPVQPMRMIWGELSLLGSRGFVPADIEEAIGFYLDGAIAIDHLVSRQRPLEEAQEALDDLRSGRVLRTVLVP